jgi:hypothetical protein
MFRSTSIILAVVGVSFLFAGAAAATERPRSVAPAGTALTFSCDGRHVCRQMRSCAEARYFLEVCGVRSLDRDNDGVPCEDICGRN